MAILRLALESVLNRRVTAGLTLLAVALSIAMLLGVEKMRREARETFANTISGTDLIVGARSGGRSSFCSTPCSASAMRPATSPGRAIAGSRSFPGCAGPCPSCSGDSHRGFRVLGTTRGYFEHYRYARRESLAFASGGPFGDVFDAVLGAEVAERLGYVLGDNLVVRARRRRGEPLRARRQTLPRRRNPCAHRHAGRTARCMSASRASPRCTSTGGRGVPVPGLKIPAEQARGMDLTPKTITAFLVGLDSKIAIFDLQRRINEYRREPLLAIIPGVALQELWRSHERRGERAARDLRDGRRDRPARDAHRHSVEPGSPPAGDGGAALGRRAPAARLRAVHERGGDAGAARRRGRGRPCSMPGS